MSVALKRLADAPQLTSGALAGTERLPADNGTADGYVTSAQLATLARHGVRLTAAQIPLDDVTDLVSSLAAKADAGALPANLAADTLTLTKRDTAPAAPGSGKCCLWILDLGDGNWALMARTGAVAEDTEIFRPIAAHSFIGDPFWSEKMCPEGGSGDDGDGFDYASPGGTSTMGSAAVSGVRFKIHTSWTFPAPVIIQQQLSDGSWLADYETSLTAGVPFLAESGTARRGNFSFLFADGLTAPNPSPTITIELLP